MTQVPGFINIQDYHYTLPEDRIAKYPLEKRDASKLLYYHGGVIESRSFGELPDLLNDRYQLVFNDTRVIHARLIFHKQTGSPIEIFLLEPWKPSEYNLSFLSTRECSWKCLVGNAKKWKSGILQKELAIKGLKTDLSAVMDEREGNHYIIRFTWDNPELNFSDIIENTGNTPIPPYLKREAEESDSSRYQTVYSENEGSVAAPTAGLHFTDDVLSGLSKKGVHQTRITLHVGAGTFIPVKTGNAAEHPMHTEHIYLNRKSLESLHHSDQKIIAVGTTSVRTLESMYHIACKIRNGEKTDNTLFLDQWEAYRNEENTPRKEALKVLLDYMDSKNLENLKISTRIMISPGYRFRMTDGMITNFHQPSSTLLLLVSAFIGDDWKKIYDYALENGYRFLSYGDGSLLLSDGVTR